MDQELEVPDEEFESRSGGSSEEGVYINEEDILQVIDIEGEGPAEEEDTDSEGEEVVDESDLRFKHSDSVYSVSVNPANPLQVASGSGDDTVCLWYLSMDTQDPLFVLKGHTDSVTRVAFSNDGDLLASCGMDALIKIWNPKTGELIHTLDGPGDSIDCCAWHPRGPVVLGGSGDGSAWMWNGKSGRIMNTFTGHSDSVTACSFTSDGNRSKVVTVSADSTIRVWNPKTAQVIHVIREGGPIPFHSGSITAMRCHPEKEIIVSGGSDGSILLCHTTSGKVLNSYREHTGGIEDIQFLSFLPCVASASLDQTVCVWDINTLQTRVKFELPSGVVRVASSIEYPHVLVCCCLGGTLHILDARAGKMVKELTGHTDGVMDLVVNGNKAFSASDDSFVRIWDFSKWI
eukprot:TRINITY_DN6713_c0_g1_i1.p1 TRINITY_DN6713_c0_g1~~TRINITY_DN6713_c0_g1_i1.p1  ORF type:complete len:424 (-),score=89.54 TRINITY_DN6713_c0_g1_i1:155-1363(-)